MEIVQSIEAFWVKTFAELFPIFIMPILCCGIVYFLVPFDEDEKATALSELFFFCMLGVSIAFLDSVSGDIIQTLLPQIIILITIIFQLVGSTAKSLGAPLRKKKTIIAASGAAICFMFARQYLVVTIGDAG